MNLKKIIKSRTFIVLSASTILLSTIIGCFIFKSKTPPTAPIVSTPIAEQSETIAAYHSALQKWLRDSHVKKNNFYTGDYIRGTFGRSNCTLYDIKGETHSYVYNEGTFYDDWQIDGQDCRRQYYRNFHTTPPPTPPKYIKIDYFNSTEEYYNILELDPQSGNRTKASHYYPDGNLESIIFYESQTGNLNKHTAYNPDGSVLYIKVYNLAIATPAKETSYNSDGSIDFIRNYDPNRFFLDHFYYPDLTPSEKQLAEQARQLALQLYKDFKINN